MNGGEGRNKGGRKAREKGERDEGERDEGWEGGESPVASNNGRKFSDINVYRFPYFPSLHLACI